MCSLRFALEDLAEPIYPRGRRWLRRTGGSRPQPSPASGRADPEVSSAPGRSSGSTNLRQLPPASTPPAGLLLEVTGPVKQKSRGSVSLRRRRSSRRGWLVREEGFNAGGLPGTWSPTLCTGAPRDASPARSTTGDTEALSAGVRTGVARARCARQRTGGRSALREGCLWAGQ
jgi:hypothetical protein